MPKKTFWSLTVIFLTSLFFLSCSELKNLEPDDSAPVIAVPTAALNYGSVTIGQSAAKSITVKNSGTAELSITATAPAGFYFGTANTTKVTYTIADGDLQVISLVFAPAEVKAYSGNLTIPIFSNID